MGVLVEFVRHGSLLIEAFSGKQLFYILCFVVQDMYLYLQLKNCEYDWLNIQVDISNVPMYDGTLFHGMHIHQYGEMTNGCDTMGSHYNPFNTHHGAPWQPKR